MADRYWKDRDRIDRATVADRDSPPRAGEHVRNDNSDRPYPDPDDSGIRYGRTGGHAEDRSVHHLSAGLEASYMEYGRQRYGGPYGAQRHGAREWPSSERCVLGLTESHTQTHAKLAPMTTGSLRRRNSANGGTRRSRTRT